MAAKPRVASVLSYTALIRTVYTALDNQLTAKKSNGLRQISWGLGLLLLIGLILLLGVRQVEATDPYGREVLLLTGDPVLGHAIFQVNCAGCHGIEANGRVGPSLLRVSARKSQVRLIQQVISGKTPPMPKFQPGPQEMADLLSYLESL